MALRHFRKFLIKTRIPAALAFAALFIKRWLVIQAKAKTSRARNRAFAAFNAGGDWRDGDLEKWPFAITGTLADRNDGLRHRS